MERSARLIDDAVSKSGCPVLTLDYDDAPNDPIATVNRIADFIGLPPNEQAVSFIDPSLRRH